MMKSLLFVILSIAAVLAADPWVKVGRSNGNTQHSVIIAVKLKDEAAATCSSLLAETSTPGSPRYGMHLPFDAMKMFSSPQNLKTVKKWLASSGIRDFDVLPNREFIRLTTSISNLEMLLNAKFYHYQSNDDVKVSVHRSDSYEIPEIVKDAIDFVSNMDVLPVVPSHARPGPFIQQRAAASGDVSPSLLKTFYNINTTLASSSVNQSLFEALGQTFTPADLKAFQQQYNVPQHAIDHVVGTNDPSQCQSNPNNCAEANLDVQWILSIAQQATTWYWSIAGEGDIFVEWITAVAGNSAAPHVHSISYGSIAKEDPKYDMERFNTEACKLGLRGLTIMIATGDDGVANFQARSDPSQCGFNPSFPATSPYITAVGATQGPEENKPEIACTSATGGLITSGGGFSNIFKRPDWQDAAVTNYLKNGPNLPPKTDFNPLGRAYPDVALMGHNYPIYIDGTQYVGSGTSASTPVFAGMITLINAIRAANGKSTLGFINPTLYKLGGSDVYHDITSGENNCCAGQPGSQTCCQYGFTASKGWDPVTGWGSVNWQKLANALVNA